MFINVTGVFILPTTSATARIIRLSEPVPQCRFFVIGFVSLKHLMPFSFPQSALLVFDEMREGMSLFIMFISSVARSWIFINICSLGVLSIFWDK